MQRVTLTIEMSSGEDIEESAAVWERVLRNTNVIAPDDVVTTVVITKE